MGAGDDPVVPDAGTVADDTSTIAPNNEVTDLSRQTIAPTAGGGILDGETKNKDPLDTVIERTEPDNSKDDANATIIGGGNDRAIDVTVPPKQPSTAGFGWGNNEGIIGGGKVNTSTSNNLFGRNNKNPEESRDDPSAAKQNAALPVEDVNYSASRPWSENPFMSRKNPFNTGKRPGAGDDNFSTAFGFFGGNNKGEADPLLGNADPNPVIDGADTAAAKKRALAQKQYAAMILLPWLAFLVSACVFCFMYFEQPVLATFFAVSIFSTGLLSIFRDTGKSGRWYLKIGILLCMSSMIGSLFGLYEFHMQWVNYYAYTELATYSNVLATSPAMAHEDAGKIYFAPNTEVDRVHTVGYRNLKVFCVAPIIEAGVAEDAKHHIEFFAAGIGCCNQRGGFTCDDSLDPKAKSGVTIRDNSGMFFSVHSYLMKAAEALTAQYGYTMSEEPVFVRWVVDPQSVQDHFASNGTSGLVVGASLYLLVCMVVGAVVQMSTRPKMARAPKSIIKPKPVQEENNNMFATMFGASSARSEPRKMQLPDV